MNRTQPPKAVQHISATPPAAIATLSGRRTRLAGDSGTRSPKAVAG